MGGKSIGRHPKRWSEDGEGRESAREREGGWIWGWRKEEGRV